MSERIKAVRERLNRREKKIRADRQARERRIEKEEPEGVGEKATVKVRKAKDEAEMSAEEARALADDAKTLVATELGVSTSEASSVIEKGAALFEDFDKQLGTLDGDKDGDTDLLTALDASLEDDNGGGGGGRGSNIDDGLGRAEAVGGEPTVKPFNLKNDLSDADIDFSEPAYDPSTDRT